MIIYITCLCDKVYFSLQHRVKPLHKLYLINPLSYVCKETWCHQKLFQIKYQHLPLNLRILYPDSHLQIDFYNDTNVNSAENF